MVIVTVKKKPRYLMKTRRQEDEKARRREDKKTRRQEDEKTIDSKAIKLKNTYK